MRENPDKQAVVMQALTEALSPYVGDAGVRLPSATWIVQARA
jgi:hypothetical protein